jgi:DNA-binding XRE family transcriptional regulator
MPQHCYHKRDSTFGRAMFKLRTSIGLTKAGMAPPLGVSRRAVGEWEAGSNYPKAEHFKHFLELCVRRALNDVLAPCHGRLLRCLLPAPPPVCCPP